MYIYGGGGGGASAEILRMILFNSFNTHRWSMFWIHYTMATSNFFPGANQIVCTVIWWYYCLWIHSPGGDIFINFSNVLCVNLPHWIYLIFFQKFSTTGDNKVGIRGSGNNSISKAATTQPPLNKRNKMKLKLKRK